MRDYIGDYYSGYYADARSLDVRSYTLFIPTIRDHIQQLKDTKRSLVQESPTGGFLIPCGDPRWCSVKRRYGLI